MSLPHGLNKSVLTKLKEWRNSALQFVVEAIGATPSKQQIELLQAAGKEKRITVRSGHGCHAKDTVIHMYPYGFKLVQDVKVGDQLMGNGRRQDFLHPLYPRNSNTYFEPGNSSLDEMIGDTILAFPKIESINLCEGTIEMGCYETFETFIHAPYFEDGNKNIDLKSLVSQVWTAIKELASTFEQNKSKKEDEKTGQKIPENVEMEKLEEMAVDLTTAKAELATKRAEFEQLQTTHEDTTTKLKEKTVEFEALQTTHTDELKKANDRIGEFEQKEADKRKATLDAQWEQLKKERIPPGLTHKAEDEKKLHAQFETDPYTFMTTLMGFKQEGGTDREGEEYNSEGTDTYAKTNAEFEEQLGVKE